MEKNEALLFLGISQVDDLEDVYESKVFEWKNFFVNRFPVPSLFQNKIQQLKKLEEAFQVLGGEMVIESPVNIELNFDNDFKVAFRQFSNRRSQLKSLLFQANSASAIIPIVSALIDLTSAYAKLWHDENLDTAGTVVSKEPDPMDLLEAIIDAENRGVQNISEIEKLPENHLVLKEAKRLSLLTRMNKI